MLKDKIYRFILNQNINMDYDVFAYGYYVVTTYCLYLGILIPVSIFNHVFVETLIFIVVFVSLRQYLGGLHFSNYLVCLIVSVFVAIIVPLISCKIGNIPIYLRLIIILISILCTNLIGPIDHKNKKMSIREKEIFRKKANIILLFYLTISLCFYHRVPIKFGNVILLTITIMNLNLLLPFLHKKMCQSNNLTEVKN